MLLLKVSMPQITNSSLFFFLKKLHTKFERRCSYNAIPYHTAIIIIRANCKRLINISRIPILPNTAGD